MRSRHHARPDSAGGDLAANYRRRLFVLIAPVRLIVVVGQAFRFRYWTASDDARLQVRDHRVDFAGCERAGRRIKIAARLSAAGARGICTFVEGGHSGPRTSTANRKFERSCVEPSGAQIRAGRRLIPLLFTIREGTMAIGASASPPKRQSRFRLIFVLRS